MIEVLFGESEACAMKVAKNTVIASKVDGPTAVWTVGKKKPPERENCGWIEGTAAEVICLGFLLDIGDIREDVNSEYRRHLVYSMYAQEQWGKDEEINAELMQLCNCYCTEMERLKTYLADGEAIRIWYSDAPYSRCGFYHLCTSLQKYPNEISAVKLPEYRVRADNSIVSYANWGEVAAEEFAGFLTFEKKLSKEEIRMYAMLWSILQEDNSPLRTVVNGKLVGVPEDFYDFLIWKRITRKPIKEARLIGDILGQNQLSVGDWWYAKRIDYFIQTGRIKIVEDSENKYARTICLAQIFTINGEVSIVDKLAIKPDEYDNKVVVIPDIIFENKQHIDWDEVEKYLERYVGESVQIAESGDVIYLGKAFPDEFAGSKYTRKTKGARAKAKANAVQGIREMVEIATKKRFHENHKEKHESDAGNGWYYYITRFALPIYNNEARTDQYNIYSGCLVVNCTSAGKMYLYDLVDIKKEASNPFKTTT